jgi:hypothetical protein
MIRHLAAILAALVVGLPLLFLPSWPVGAIAFVAGASLAGGMLMLRAPLLTVGVTLGLVEYALALRLPAGPSDPLTAVALGVSILLLLQVVDFSRRFRGAAVESAVIRGQLRYWLTTAVATGAGALLVYALGTALAQALPPAGYPTLAVVGALAAVIGAARVVAQGEA